MTNDGQGKGKTQRLSKHVSINLEGEPVRILQELRCRGFARSNSAAITEALLHYWRLVVDVEEREAAVKAIRATREGGVSHSEAGAK